MGIVINKGNLRGFSLNSRIIPQYPFPVEYLVVAGGGAGGIGTGAGGGAGGFRTGNLSISFDNVNIDFPVVVGAGGSTKDGNGFTGSNSSFLCIISNGGVVADLIDKEYQHQLI